MHLNLIAAILAACWLVTVVMGFFVGLYLNHLRAAIRKLSDTLDEVYKDNNATIEEESPSMLIDMDDPAQIAAYEHEQQMRKLNPGLYEDDE